MNTNKSIIISTALLITTLMSQIGVFANDVTTFTRNSALVMTNEQFNTWYQNNFAGNNANIHPVSLNEPLQGRLEKTTYALGPGDVISILVQDQPEFSRKKVVIGTDGIITVPYGGEVQVLDKSRDMLAAEISYILSEYIINPRVDINILRRRPSITYVFGSVDKPGQYFQLPVGADLPDVKNVITHSQFHLTEALTAAGGIIENGDLRHVHVYNEKKGYHRVINMMDLLILGKTSEDVILKPYDVVYVPRLDEPNSIDTETLKLLATSTVGKEKYPIRVYGSVTQPNIYDFKPEEMTLQSAIARAGGPLQDAKISHVVVARTQHDGSLKKIVVNAEETDLMLQPNDLVLLTERRKTAKFFDIMQIISRSMSPITQSSFILRNLDTVYGLSDEGGS